MPKKKSVEKKGVEKKKQTKRRAIFYIVFAIIILLVIFGAVGYLLFGLPSYGGNVGGVNPGTSKGSSNPVYGLDDNAALEQFDEGFVRYLLYAMGVQNLHNPPFSSDTPKLEIYVGDETYNAEVVDGNVKVSKGEISKEDIRIWTSKEEIIKMLRNGNYVTDSFNNGGSAIELVASKTKLGLKGYVELYDRFS